VTVLRNNFDGGPDGTTLTAANSGQVPGNDAFNSVTTKTASNIIQYTDASGLDRQTAEYVLECSTSAVAQANCAWTTSMGSQTQIWLRLYFYMTATPTTNDMCIFESDNGSAYAGCIYVEATTNKMYVSRANTGALLTMTTPAPLNKWLRIEAWFSFSTTAGDAELRLYTDADSDAASETISLGTAWVTNNANAFAFGQPFATGNKPTTYFSGLELNNTGWPGPAPFKVKGVPGIQPSPVAVHSDVF
jgi:hypothetical protein